jgi:hypothetical protein
VRSVHPGFSHTFRCDVQHCSRFLPPPWLVRAPAGPSVRRVSLWRQAGALRQTVGAPQVVRQQHGAALQQVLEVRALLHDLAQLRLPPAPCSARQCPATYATPHTRRADTDSRGAHAQGAIMGWGAGKGGEPYAPRRVSAAAPWRRGHGCADRRAPVWSSPTSTAPCPPWPLTPRPRASGKGGGQCGEACGAQHQHTMKRHTDVCGCGRWDVRVRQAPPPPALWQTTRSCAQKVHWCEGARVQQGTRKRPIHVDTRACGGSWPRAHDGQVHEEAQAAATYGGSSPDPCRRGGACRRAAMRVRHRRSARPGRVRRLCVPATAAHAGRSGRAAGSGRGRHRPHVAGEPEHVHVCPSQLTASSTALPAVSRVQCRNARRAVLRSDLRAAAPVQPAGP